jgi:flagellar basal-body rod protein FlgB
MEATNAVLMLKSLDCLSLRMQVLAQNIANAGTPRYRPMQLTFEDALRAAAADGDAAVAAFAPTPEPAPPVSGSADLRLDLELADASATAGRYGSLIDILNRQLQLQSLAIGGSN